MSTPQPLTPDLRERQRLRNETRQIVLREILDAATKELNRIHGKSTVYYVLAYQRVSKEIIKAVEMAP